MKDNDPIKAYNRFKANTIDNLLYGKDEDIFVRNARRKESEAKYGNRHVLAWTPFLFAYVNIKKDLNNPDYTTLEKIGGCAVSIVCELILDVARVGGVYGLYKFADYLDIFKF